MKFKSLILGGAAIVGLAGSPAMATSHPSTPEEQRQTDDLNAQQLAKAQAQSTTQTATIETAPQTTASTAAPADTTAMNTPSAAPTTAVEAPAAGAPAAGTGGTIALSMIANPPQTLANASVETSTGQAIGAVQKVVIDGNGKAQTVDVALLGPQSKIVAIDAAKLTYDQSRNVVVAQLSADEIQALPPAPQG